MKSSQERHLHELGRLYRIQTSYRDGTGRQRKASARSLLLALRALGAPLNTLNDALVALRERRQALWRRVVDPVVVVWEGMPLRVAIRLSQTDLVARAGIQLNFSEGKVLRCECDLRNLPVLETVEVEGSLYVLKELKLARILPPLGYHDFRLEIHGKQFTALVVCAPFAANGFETEAHERRWGVFLPLYSVHSRESWGAGDLGDLKALKDWTESLGGHVVGTLPLLSCFLDDPFCPSPYSPASRLFWNEFYVDVHAALELSDCPRARLEVGLPEFREELDQLRSAPLVDYKRQMRAKRRILEELCRCLYEKKGKPYALFRCFVKEREQLGDYACFRAATEKQRAPWFQWPGRLRDGDLEPGDYDESCKRYHLYVQWLIEEQLAAVSGKREGKEGRLYLDLPLGVHPASYDVWREKELFVREASGGAPPDAFFQAGQDWGFPPLHPDGSREQGYRYMIACLRHHFEHASFLRIDHAMSLHRLFWIPKGLEARQGVYVHYPAKELYAVLNLEAYLHRCVVVAENLGTVPSYINRSLARHKVCQMYVVQYEQNPLLPQVLREPAANQVASFNTHDMYPFGSFWATADVADRVKLGLLDPGKAKRERADRNLSKKRLALFLKSKGLLGNGPAGERAMLEGLVAFLGKSRARLVLINLEDLWLETEPQNLPNTGMEQPNWQRKARYSLEALSELPLVVDSLKKLNQLRRLVSLREPRLRHGPAHGST